MITRDAITVALARTLIARQFPQWASLPVRPVEHSGWDNRTFRLGADLLIRLPTGPWYAQQVEKEQRWLPRLAPLLPLRVPVPVARGAADESFPFPWSVYRWLPGRPLAVAPVDDRSALAADLAGFLRALYAIRPADGPDPGEHNFFRGAALQVYDGETRRALAELAARGLDLPRATPDVWAAGLASRWTGPPVWFHGDVAAGNLLVDSGRLSAVIDFGCCGVGDPACDLAIAWTEFDAAERRVLRAALALDDDTWARGRAWALWKALITLAAGTDDGARRTLERVVADHLEAN